ncbi:pyruvate, phosphate dikinase, chloroplastic-like [Castanea sativa]|uniref:pyruvate, phosphate dikinase, chloroplastic-like n=1 Tax=Castanea sativa TaxID=21020 RepID=UPI003F64FE29
MESNNSKNTETIKFLCSYGGKILPRYTNGTLRYAGDLTRVLVVDRSISFTELMVKLGEFCGSSVNLQCQLPIGDLETLILITSGDRLRRDGRQSYLRQLTEVEVGFSYGKFSKRRLFGFSLGLSLGGKGANLAEMASIGLSVPPGLTISTEACQEYQLNGKKLPEGLWEEILEGLETVEKDMGAFLGDPSKPLLHSVRSGAAISMPGMMETVLNLGLNDEVVAGLASKSGERFAYDSYRRFLDMFGDVVLGIPHTLFKEKLEMLKNAKGVNLDTELTSSDLKELVEQYKNVYLETKSEKFPSDPKQQLLLAVKAVFDSWDSSRAIKYRSINQITGLKGTAVNIQCMVFGNMGNTSGTGVLFTRNPSTGEKKLYGEFLVNAQGKGVVAGIRTPEDLDTMKSCMPKAYKELVENCEILERHYKDMMGIEFTVQENRLWMLQCCSRKRTGKGAVKIAVDMANEGLVDMRSAIKMVEPQLLHPQWMKTLEALVQWASHFLIDFAATTDANAVKPEIVNVTWTPPPSSVLKINVDGALSKTSSSVGIGVVIRDNAGRLIATLCKHFHVLLGPIETEAKAFEAGLQLAWDLGLQNIVLEGDSLVILRALYALSNPPSSVDSLCLGMQLIYSEFHSVNVSHVQRQRNKPAHLLAKFALSIHDYCVWIGESPSCIVQALIQDSVIVSFD